MMMIEIMISYVNSDVMMMIPIVVTLVGIVTDVSDEHESKA